MTSTTSASGTAARQGRLWGTRAQDWAEHEEQEVDRYREAIEHVGIEPDDAVLEVGCGSGVFLRMAADRGAQVAGLDASEALIEIARRRVPGADLRVGDLQFLPYEDDRFDLVAGFSAFFFAADMTEALREAGRVAKPGAPGALERIATGAGLTPQDRFHASFPIDYPDEPTLLRWLLSAGGVVEAVGHSGEEAVRRAIVETQSPFRNADGGYRLENEWTYLIAA